MAKIVSQKRLETWSKRQKDLTLNEYLSRKDHGVSKGTVYKQMFFGRGWVDKIIQKDASAEINKKTETM